GTLPALHARRQQAVLLQLARELGAHAAALAQLDLVDLRLGRAQALRPAARTLRAWHLELLADHAERQELVPLQAQDRLQALDVGVGEEPVAAARAPGRQEPLVLEVADLGDRDVGKLGLEAPAHLADRVQPRRPRVLGRRHRCRKVSRYLPICTSSSWWSCADSTRRRLTKVPL